MTKIKGRGSVPENAPPLEIVITSGARDLLFCDEKQIPPRAEALVVMTRIKGCGNVNYGLWERA
jgi:hypothetical protein